MVFESMWNSRLRKYKVSIVCRCFSPTHNKRLGTKRLDPALILHFSTPFPFSILFTILFLLLSSTRYDVYDFIWYRSSIFPKPGSGILSFSLQAILYFHSFIYLLFFFFSFLCPRIILVLYYCSSCSPVLISFIFPLSPPSISNPGSLVLFFLILAIANFLKILFNHSYFFFFFTFSFNNNFYIFLFFPPCRSNLFLSPLNPLKSFDSLL